MSILKIKKSNQFITIFEKAKSMVNINIIDNNCKIANLKNLIKRKKQTKWLISKIG